MKIIRELNNKFLMYCYPIYTIDTWSILAINNPTLMSMYQPYIVIRRKCGQTLVGLGLGQK